MDGSDSHTSEQMHRHNQFRSSMDMSSDHKGSGVFGIMLIATVAGAMFGGALAMLIAPQFAPALMIGFALSFSAAGVMFVLRRTAEAHASPDEYAGGKSRTEEEVRQALAEIKSDTK